MWIKRTGNAQKKHRCNPPAKDVPRWEGDEAGWPAPDGHVGDVWICDDCEHVWIIVPSGDWGGWNDADWWTSRKARKKLHQKRLEATAESIIAEMQRDWKDVEIDRLRRLNKELEDQLKDATRS